MTLEIIFKKFRSPSWPQFPTWKPTWECVGSFPHTFLHSHEHEMWLLGFTFGPHLCKSLFSSQAPKLKFRHDVCESKIIISNPNYLVCLIASMATWDPCPSKLRKCISICLFIQLSFPCIRLVIHPSKFLIPKEENERRGGRRTNGSSSSLSKCLCDPICVQRSLLTSLLVVRSLGRCKWWRPPVLAFPYIYNILGVYMSGRCSPWGKGVKVRVVD